MPVWCTRPSTRFPPRHQAHGRCTHPWYVRTRGMRGNRRLLSFGNLAPGKHRRDDGSPRPERVHRSRTATKYYILASAKCYRDERSGALLFCSSLPDESNERTRKLTLAGDKRHSVICSFDKTTYYKSWLHMHLASSSYFIY